jgi:cell division protein FtsW
VFCVLALLVLLERDFGGVATLLLVLMGLLWAGGMPLRWFAALIGVGAVLLALMVAVAPYRMQRITAFLDPFADASNSGFQAVRGLYALAEGGIWGVGLGNSAMKWNLLPEAESDYIFAIIGEELGFLGGLVVVTLYGVLAYAGFRIARRSADRFIQLASTGITVWLIGQAAMNMGYVVGLLPVTGVTLPLISAGGTSLVLTLFIVGLLVRFARSEPEAIEAERTRERGRFARLLLPVPAVAVDPVRPRRQREPHPPARPGRAPRKPVAEEPRRPVRRPAPPPATRGERLREHPPPAARPRRPDAGRVVSRSTAPNRRAGGPR